MVTPTPSWQTVRVHGTWVNQDGSMKAGTYKVTMPVRVTNSTDDVIIPRGVFASGPLNTTSGLPSLDVQVPASDDPDNSPQGFQPTIEVTFLDAPGELYALTVPVALSGNAGGIDLATVILTDTLPIPAEVFIRGVAGGLAELDAQGFVVDASGTRVGTPDLSGYARTGSQGRTDLGLGSAATHPVSDFDTAGAATAVQVANRLALVRSPDALITGTITRDANGAATSAPVTWPDGSPGTYTATTLSSAFPGAVDAYTITYGSPVTKTYTQPAVTRDANGAAVTVPAVTVA